MNYIPYSAYLYSATYDILGKIFTVTFPLPILNLYGDTLNNKPHYQLYIKKFELCIYSPRIHELGIFSDNSDTSTYHTLLLDKIIFIHANIVYNKNILWCTEAKIYTNTSRPRSNRYISLLD